jgi:hypothetical protein
MFLFRLFGSRGSGTKLCSVLPSDDILVHGEIRGEDYHACWFGGLAMKIGVSVVLWDLFGFLGFAAAICSGTAAQLKFRRNSNEDSSRCGIVGLV